MNWMDVLYWVVIGDLCVLSVLNLRGISRNRRCRKEYEKAIQETWAARDAYYDMRDELRKD